MDTKESEVGDVYNSAIAAVLRARKAELRLTFDDIEAATGIGVQTLKRLINDQRSIHMGHFIKIVAALDLDAAEVVQAAAARVEKTAS